MEQGTLVQANEPFDFHESMHLVGLSYRSQAELSGVRFDLELDPRIDMVAHAFIGDEMRLRQITCNLVSNALKFTEPGGSVRLVTKLVQPSVPRRTEDTAEADHESVDQAELDRKQPRRPPSEKGSTEHERQRDVCRSSTSSASAVSSTKAVVRVEIHDTGVGLEPADLVDNNLFMPYVQTEIGRRQGGKGSGLGLALVMQIVKLSQGRLGVDSEVGKGSCFWFEMPYDVSSAKDPSTRESQQVLPTRSSFLNVMGSAPRPEPDLAYEALPSCPSPPLQQSSPNAPIHERVLPAPDSEASPTLSPTASHSSPPTLSRTSPAPKLDRAQSVETAILTPPELGPKLFSDSQPSMPPLSPMSESVLPSVSLTSKQVEPAAKAPQGIGSLSTLVVDDDSLTRRLMSRMLTRLGHKVTSADNGQKALDLILAQPDEFNVVFLDNQMPIMNGVEVVSALREEGNDIYVVGCTGNALREDQDEYIASGANAILAKPIHQAAILDHLAEAKRRSDVKERRRSEAGRT